MQKLIPQIKILASLLLSFIIISTPQISMAGTAFGQASDIANVGAGARAMAMGGAFTGLADDASASYYNPSGLAFLDEHQFMAMHAPLFLNTNYNYISSAHPFGDKWGTMAFSLALLNSDGFEIRDRFNSVTNSNGSLANNTFAGSYARKLPLNLATGVNLKLLQQKIDGYSGGDFGLDLSFMYRPTTLFQAGFMLANINSPEITLDTETDQYSPLTRFGLASEVFKNKLVLTADASKTSNQSTLFAAGFEYTPAKLFQLRGGFNANQSYTFGIGLNIKPFHIDYAFSDTDIGAFSKFSFTWAWHNIYETGIEPPLKEGRAVYPLSGFDNTVAFQTRVPGHLVSHWALNIKDKEGNLVKSMTGDLTPPDVINWDARNEVGEPVIQGAYSYSFSVEYQNGKSWTVGGNVSLELPDHSVKEVIDMTLYLNGSQAENNSSAVKIMDSEKIPGPLLIEKKETAPINLDSTNIIPTINAVNPEATEAIEKGE